MKNTLIAAALLLAFAGIASAQTTPAPAPAPGAPASVGPNFVDANGDGICDRFQSGQAGQGRRYGNGTRPRPQDGTGLGPGPSAGGGTCDGTGPKGQGRRGGRR
jgi:hypothetical protein